MPLIDQFGKAVTQGSGYRWGQRISHLFHPTTNGVLSFLVVGVWGQTGGSVLRGLAWAITCIIVLVTPPTLYFRQRLKHGDYSDDDVSRRGERNTLYAASLVTIMVGSVVLYFVGVPHIFLRLIAAVVGIVGTCALVNLIWKISVHSASVATLATLLTLFVPGFGLAFWLVVVLVGWARMRTGNHTALQVAAGWGVAVVGVVAAFTLGR